MSAQAAALATSITSADHAALKSAVKYLETRNFAGRLADYAGVPIHRVLGFLPKALNRQLSGAVRHAVMFGFGALAVELPLTTTLMLRAIAEIAQHQGEDLSTLEARLACLEVFAYGAKRNEDNLDVGYYAARALISKYTHDIAALALERGAIDASAPVVASLVSEIVSRFGLVVSDKVAAGALPIIGAVGGATVNIVFMDHFQRVAHAHFTLRRLERAYGTAHIRQRYAELAPTKPNAIA
jgi:uncharacterized membrane protein